MMKMIMKMNLKVLNLKNNYKTMFKTNYNSAIDAVSKMITYTGKTINLSFTINPMSHFDIWAKMGGEIFIIEHKFRDNAIINTSDLFMQKYPDGVILERSKYDSIANYLSFNPHIDGWFYINSFADDSHIIYDMRSLILPPQQQMMCNVTTHSNNGKKMKWVYVLPYEKAIILK